MKIILSIIIMLISLSGQIHSQWKELNFPSSLKVNSIVAIDSMIIAGTNGDGIFASTDNGENWTDMSSGLQDKVIHTLFIEGEAIFAGSEFGASVSTDNGLSWNTINSGLSGKGVWSFAAGSMYGGSRIYAGTWSGLYYSTDNGENWNETGLSSTEMPIHSIVVYDSYLTAATLAGGVFRSKASVYSWDDISVTEFDNTTGITSLIPVYSISKIDTNIVAGVGSGKIYYKNFKDSLFSKPSTLSGLGKPILSFFPHNFDIYAGDSYGEIFRSSDAGITWNINFPRLSLRCIYSIVVNDSYIFAGTERGMWRYGLPKPITGVEKSNEIQQVFALEQNYPNPFNPSTTIKYSIPFVETNRDASLHVTLRVYDILGREMTTLVNENKTPGDYIVNFDASNLPAGVYFYSLITNEFRCTKKLILLK